MEKYEDGIEQALKQHSIRIDGLYDKLERMKDELTNKLAQLADALLQSVRGRISQ